MQPVLCKKAGTTWNEVFEIMKLGLSADGKAIYVRLTLQTPEQGSTPHYYWRNVVDMDKRWDVVDTLSSKQ